MSTLLPRRTSYITTISSVVAAQLPTTLHRNLQRENSSSSSSFNVHLLLLQLFPSVFFFWHFAFVGLLFSSFQDVEGVRAETRRKDKFRPTNEENVNYVCAEDENPFDHRKTRVSARCEPTKTTERKGRIGNESVRTQSINLVVAVAAIWWCGDQDDDDEDDASI